MLYTHQIDTYYTYHTRPSVRLPSRPEASSSHLPLSLTPLKVCRRYAIHFNIVAVDVILCVFFSFRCCCCCCWLFGDDDDAAATATALLLTVFTVTQHNFNRNICCWHWYYCFGQYLPDWICYNHRKRFALSIALLEFIWEVQKFTLTNLPPPIAYVDMCETDKEGWDRRVDMRRRWW